MQDPAQGWLPDASCVVLGFSSYSARDIKMPYGRIEWLEEMLNESSWKFWLTFSGYPRCPQRSFRVLSGTNIGSSAWRLVRIWQHIHSLRDSSAVRMVWIWSLPAWSIREGGGTRRPVKSIDWPIGISGIPRGYFSRDKGTQAILRNSVWTLATFVRHLQTSDGLQMSIGWCSAAQRDL